MKTLEKLIDIAGTILISGTGINEKSKIEEIFDDNLDVIEFVMATEEEFDIEITDIEMEKSKTFGDVVKFLDAKIKEKNEKNKS